MGVYRSITGAAARIVRVTHGCSISSGGLTGSGSLQSVGGKPRTERYCMWPPARPWALVLLLIVLILSYHSQQPSHWNFFLKLLKGHHTWRLCLGSGGYPIVLGSRLLSSREEGKKKTPHLSEGLGDEVSWASVNPASVTMPSWNLPAGKFDHVKRRLSIYSMRLMYTLVFKVSLWRRQRNIWLLLDKISIKNNFKTLMLLFRTI